MFQLVQHLKICYLRLVTRLGERVESRLYELGHPAAEDRLLAEEVRLGLLVERRLDAARARPADPFRVGEGELQRITRRVLEYGDEAWHALTLLVHPANERARPFRRYHEYVDLLRGLYLFKSYIEAVRKYEGLALRHIFGYVAFIDLGLKVVLGQDLNNVACLRRLGSGDGVETVVDRVL